MKIKPKFKRSMAVLLAALFLTISGCSDPFFIRVAHIEGVPETGTVGTPLTLTATVRPAFANNNDIVWNIEDAGTTGADISGNILNASAEGTVLIRAVIANGLAEGKDYTQNFEIEFVEGDALITPITSVALNITPQVTPSVSHFFFDVWHFKFQSLNLFQPGKTYYA